MKLKQRFVGVVYIDGELFTHPNFLMGISGLTCRNVLNQLRGNVIETLTADYIKSHLVVLSVKDLYLDQVENFPLFLYK